MAAGNGRLAGQRNLLLRVLWTAFAVTIAPRSTGYGGDFMQVTFRLLGRPQVLVDDRWRDVAVNRPLLLIAYLSVQSGWVHRDEAAFTFWPDVDQRQARANLRQLVRRARALALGTRLESTPTALRLEVASDVEAFTRACGSSAWADAVELYRGDLLAGVESLDRTDTLEWVSVERESLRRRWRDACERRAEALARGGHHAAAAELLQRLLERDELAEDVLQTYLRDALGGSQRQRALQLFRAFEERLGRELGLTPLDATRALARRLHESSGATGAEATTAEDAKAATTEAAAVDPTDPSALPARPGPHDRFAATPIQSRLSTPTTSLIGRSRELGELDDLLRDPERRLVTLVGTGGSGKTRLALEVAAAHRHHFLHGCHDIAFAALDDVDLVPIAIADQLGLAFAGRDDPVDQLCAWLRDKRMLLVLDNLEHLLDGFGFVPELLDACPGVRLLATSREPLGIAGETVFDVPGLSHPAHGETASEGQDAFDAVRFFVTRARHQAPTFRMLADDKHAVLELCRYVRGNPLALELAAVWVRLLRPAEILDAVRSDIDALAPPDAEADHAGRHESLRSVFDHSWSLLNEAERSALVALAVFRGGAAKEAVLAVTRAPLRTTLALVNKSLLERSEAGRFEMLEPLRQYVTARARTAGGASPEARDRHARWFAELLAEQGPELKGGPGQHRAFETLERDWPNVRAAWRHACGSADARTLTTMVPRLAVFLERRGRFREGLAALREAQAAFTEPAPLRRRLDVWVAAFQTHLGAFTDAHAALCHVVRTGAADDAETAAHARLRLGMVERLRGAYEAAREHTAAALALAQQRDDRSLAAEATNNLGVLAAMRGDLADAKGHFVASARYREAIGDRWAASIALLNLGNIERDLGKLDDAERHYRGSLEAAREHGNPRGVAFALGTLASIEVFRGAYTSAERRYREALDLRRTLGDQWGEANTLQHLASVLATRSGESERTPGEALAEAERLLAAAADLVEALGDDQGRANLTATQALVLARSGRHAEAAARYEEAMERSAAVGHAHGVQTARDGLARAVLASGDAKRAETLHLEVLRFASEAGFVQLQLAAVTGLAECRAALGDHALAVRSCDAVTGHPAAAHELRTRVASVLERLSSLAPGDVPSTSTEETAPAEDALARVVDAFLRSQAPRHPDHGAVRPARKP